MHSYKGTSLSYNAITAAYEDGDDFTKVLKQATQTAHRKLDKHPLVSNLLNKEIDYAKYRTLMYRFYMAFQDIELVLAAKERDIFLGNCPPFQTRFLKQVEKTEVVENIHYQESFFPEGIDEQQYWAIRYVLDGSAHGARMLLPKLIKHKDIQNDYTLNYWQRLADLYTYWSKLVERINTIKIDKQTSLHMINSSVHTFEFIYNKITD